MEVSCMFSLYFHALLSYSSLGMCHWSSLDSELAGPWVWSATISHDPSSHVTEPSRGTKPSWLSEALADLLWAGQLESESGLIHDLRGNYRKQGRWKRCAPWRHDGKDLACSTWTHSRHLTPLKAAEAGNYLYLVHQELCVVHEFPEPTEAGSSFQQPWDHANRWILLPFRDTGESPFLLSRLTNFPRAAHPFHNFPKLIIFISCNSGFHRWSQHCRKHI